MAHEFVARNGIIALNNSIITGSLNVTNGITGSLQGTSSYSNNALSASYALTASFAMNSGGGGVSAIYIADEGIIQGTASYFDFIGAGVTASVSSGTASINITGGGGGSAIQGASQVFSQSISANTWSFAHAINSRTPVVEVYDSSYNVIIPTAINNPGPFATNIYFDIAESGYAIISTGGVLAVTGSNAILNQTSASTTWSFNHELSTQYPVFTIFDNNDDIIIPERVHVVDTASAEIYFSSPRTGKAVASLGGSTTSISSSYSVSSSYAFNATSASYALTSSYSLSGTGFPYSGSAIITGSLLVSGSGITGSLFGTSSYSDQSLSASYALTASFALNGGGGGGSVDELQVVLLSQVY